MRSAHQPRSMRQRLFAGRLAAFCIAFSLVMVNARTLLAAGTHYVFAHYTVCYADYGETVDGYKRDIQEAQAAGIDGFALNMGAYDNVQAYYSNRVALI